MGYLFSESEQLFNEFDPEVIPIIELPQSGWVEIGKGIWLHGPEQATCYVSHLYDYTYVNGKPTLKLSRTKVDLSWDEDEAGDIADTVRKRLEALGANLCWPPYVVDGSESLYTYFRSPTRFKPRQNSWHLRIPIFWDK